MKRTAFCSIVAAVMISIVACVLPARASENETVTEDLSATVSEEPSVATSEEPASIVEEPYEEGTKVIPAEEATEIEEAPPAAEKIPETETTTAPASNSSETPENGIPALYLTIDPDEFQKIVDSEDHSYRSYGGTVRIELPEEYEGEFAEIDPTGIDSELELEFIRGRGNSTWGAGKNPFKIKLDKSTDLLGMGKNKHWVLLANHYDASLLRNRIVTYMGRELDLEFTPEMVPVDFYINGEYMGSYAISEEIRIGKSRVDIDEIDPSATSGDEITGGYLLALSPYDDEPEENKFMTAQGVGFLMDSPVFDSSDSEEQAAQEQYDYITNYLQMTENAIFGDGCKDENGVSYAEYMDIESAARYWWVQQLCDNTDAFMTQSTYLYKKRGGKLYWGPLWDFDYTMLEIPEEGENPFNDQEMIWLDHLRENDPQFQDTLRRVWEEYESIIESITRPGGLLDRYTEEIRPSWEDNFDRWFSGKPVVGIDLDEDTELIREFLEEKRRQVNKDIDELLTKVNCTVTYMDGEQVLFTRTVRSGSYFSSSLDTEEPEKEGFLFNGWMDEKGTHPDPYDFLNTDIILKADFIKDEDATGPDHIFFEPYDRWISVRSGGAILFYVLVPEDVQDTRISWAVSDPEIAEISVRGDWAVIIPKKIGDTLITGTMKSGLQESLALHVYDPDVFPTGELTAVVPLETELRLYVGESGQVRFLLTPENNRPTLLFASNDEEIASVEKEFGIVTGLAPGTTRITVIDFISDIETEYTVIVLERTEPEDESEPDSGQEDPAAVEEPDDTGGGTPPEEMRTYDRSRQENGKGGVPDTGDDNDLWLWSILLLASLAGIFKAKQYYR